MKINEIFYSLQGEGHFTGTPAVFLRFAGCNLKCWFCDTEFLSYKEMTEEEIVAEVTKYPARHIVITGGEPTLQLTTSLEQKLHRAGFFIMLETNGTHELPDDATIDWVTCSPKLQSPSPSVLAPLRIQHIDELKVVYEGNGQNMSVYDGIQATEYRLQPCATDDEEKNKMILSETIDYILANPRWQLSLQTHKLLGVR